MNTTGNHGAVARRPDTAMVTGSALCTNIQDLLHEDPCQWNDMPSTVNIYIHYCNADDTLTQRAQMLTTVTRQRHAQIYIMRVMGRKGGG